MKIKKTLKITLLSLLALSLIFTILYRLKIPRSIYNIQSQASVCIQDSDCILVDTGVNRHCCDDSRITINKKYTNYLDEITAYRTTQREKTDWGFCAYVKCTQLGKDPLIECHKNTCQLSRFKR